MSAVGEEDWGSKFRLRVLLDHFARIEDPREVRWILHPLPEVLLLVVFGTMADCDDYENMASWGEAHLPFLRRYLPYEHGVPGAVADDPDEPGRSGALLGCLHGLGAGVLPGSSRFRCHRLQDLAPQPRPARRHGAIHLVSAFATTTRLVLAQEAVPDKANELAAIPVLLERLGAEGGLSGALVSIDAIATNPTVAAAIRAQGADYLLAVKANQPTLRTEVEAAFAEVDPAALNRHVDLDKGHGRVEERRVAVLREVDRLSGDRRFPGELRLPNVAAIVRVETTARLADQARTDKRYFISSAALTAERAAAAVRGHWGIENRLHWVLDVVFRDDQSRPRIGHGAKNMAVVRHFALNLVRAANDKKSLKTRRKLAGWSHDYLASLLNPSTR